MYPGTVVVTSLAVALSFVVEVHVHDGDALEDVGMTPCSHMDWKISTSF